MPNKIYGGKLTLPSPTEESEQITFKILVNTDPDVEDGLVIFVNDVLAFGDDSDWNY